MIGSPFSLFQKFQHAAHQRGVLRVQPGGERLAVPLAGPDAVDGLGQPPAVLLQAGEYRLDLAVRSGSSRCIAIFKMTAIG